MFYCANSPADLVTDQLIYEGTEVLSKLEDIYLNILRAMVLGIATIALVVFVFAAIQSGPLVSQLVGIEPKAEISDATLATFVSENRASLNAAGGTSAGSDATNVSALAPPEIKVDAGNLQQYFTKHHGYALAETDVMTWLMKNYNEMPMQYQADYAKSLAEMTQQMVNAVGTPLSPENVDRALSWHAQKFRSGAAEAEAKAVADRAKAMLAISVAGIALLAVLIVIFFFVVVKIERNLRVVRVETAVN